MASCPRVGQLASVPLRGRQGRDGFADAAAAFAQTETVYDAAGVIGVIAHAEMSEDGLGEVRSGPAFCLDARRRRPSLIDVGDGLELIRAETTGAPGRTVLAERLDALSVQLTVPS